MKEVFSNNNRTYQGWLNNGFSALFKSLVGAREFYIFVFIIVVGALIGSLVPSFLSLPNITAVAIGMATDGIIAVAMTVNLVGGGFDLSVGSVLAFGGVLVALLLGQGISVLLAVVITLLAGAVIGLGNGLIVTKVGVNPLITTLGTMTIMSSGALVLSGGNPLSPNGFSFLGQGTIVGWPVAVVIMIIVVIIGDFLLRRMSLLRLVYYVGSNRNAAALSGISIDRVSIATYVFTAMSAAFSGIVLTSRLSEASPLAGAQTALTVIAACVIGGASLSGGEGTILGAILGAVLMALINNALVLLNVSINWQGIVSGSVLILAVAFDTITKKRRAA